jgi:hypothetical protein
MMRSRFRVHSVPGVLSANRKLFSSRLAAALGRVVA